MGLQKSVFCRCYHLLPLSLGSDLEVTAPQLEEGPQLRWRKAGGTEGRDIWTMGQDREIPLNIHRNSGA